MSCRPPKIIAFSGKLRCGKDTCARHLAGYLAKSGLRAKTFAFAYHIRRFLVEYLGLDEDLVFSEDKTQLTPLKWGDMPHFAQLELDRLRDHGNNYFAFTPGDPNRLMTVREVLEQVGTNVMRRMNNRAWVDMTIRECLASDADLAIITDLREPIEFDAVAGVGGKVVRLTRTVPEAQRNTHSSNTLLDPENFNWGRFHAVIDNDRLGVELTNTHLEILAREWGLLS
jgi:hypothetical protein